LIIEMLCRSVTKRHDAALSAELSSLAARHMTTDGPRVPR
jgi:hypothetical protein